MTIAIASPIKLRSQIIDYSIKNGYKAEHFAIAKYCEDHIFRLVINEEEGVVARICTVCDTKHGIGDSDDYFDEVEVVYPVTCSCGHNQFEIMAGVALYRMSGDVRWFYLGYECSACGLSGVYGDWKNEFIGYTNLLKRV